MKKRFLAALLSLCMTLTLLPTTAFAALSDLLGNTPKENQAILEQLSALTGGSSESVMHRHSTSAKKRFIMSSFPPVSAVRYCPPRLFFGFLCF